MTPQDSQSLVIGSLSVAGAIVAANSIAQGEAPDFGQVVGFTFVALGLGTAAMFAPDLAGSMAVLVLTSAVFIYGEPALDAIASTTKASKATNPKKNPGRTVTA